MSVNNNGTEFLTFRVVGVSGAVLHAPFDAREGEFPLEIARRKVPDAQPWELQILKNESWEWV